MKSAINCLVLILNLHALSVSTWAQQRSTSHETPRDVPFIYANRLIYVDVKINDQHNMLFVLDTGASKSTIDISTAKKAQLEIGGASKVEGTGGTIDVKNATIGRMSVGECHADDLIVPAYDLSGFIAPPGRAVEGIIGFDFLKQFSVTVDFKKRLLNFAASGEGTKVEKDRTSFPIEIENGIPRFDVVLNGSIQTSMRVDSGASLFETPDTYLNIPSDTWEKLQQADPELKPQMHFSATGAGGKQIRLPVSKLQQLSVGDIVIDCPYVIVQPPVGYFARPDAVGFVSNNLLEKFSPVTIDYCNHCMLLTHAQYEYQSPKELNDGWTVAMPKINKEKKQRLVRGLQKIQNGWFPEVHSVVIVKNKEIVCEAYFPGHDSTGRLVQWDVNTKHELQSATKSFRSMFIGIAIDKGFIADEHASFTSFFPGIDIKDGAEPKRGIELSHVLSMSAGFDWDEWSIPHGQPGNTLTEMYVLPSRQWASFVVNRPIAHDPGKHFAYCTGTSLMLAGVVENASSMSLGEFDNQYYSGLVGGVPKLSAYGAAMTPRAMAKLGQIYLDGGMWEDQRIVSKRWVDESVRIHHKTKATAGNYGYQWWIKPLVTAKKEYHSFHASGNGGQFIFVVPELDLVVVFTGGNFGSDKMYDVVKVLSTNILPAFEELP
jgi:CubicO group peptidase (beta-lactamase class C family)